jgi:lambda family phage portal protein
VAAADCLHVFRAQRPGQQRGESWFTPVLYLLRLLREYLEADLVRQKTSALLAGFVRSPSGQLNPFGTPQNPNGALAALEPATMTLLPAEAEVTFSSPVDHGAAFDPFMKHVIRQVFAGMNLPYELSGDLASVTFASGRAGLIEFRRQIESVQYGCLIPLLAQPVLNRWLELAQALGYADAQLERPRWACPVPQALDARMEVQTDILRVRAGFASRREIVESSGWNVEDVDAEIAADQERARRLGLVLDVDSAHTQQGQSQPEPSMEGQQS